MPQQENQNQDPSLRQSPDAGGPDRITQENQQIARLNAERQRRRQVIETLANPVIPPLRRKSALKKALPYLIAGGSTGAGIGAALTGFFS